METKLTALSEELKKAREKVIEAFEMLESNTIEREAGVSHLMSQHAKVRELEREYHAVFYNLK